MQTSCRDLQHRAEGQSWSLPGLGDIWHLEYRKKHQQPVTCQHGWMLQPVELSGSGVHLAQVLLTTSDTSVQGKPQP